ncbi:MULTISPECIES: hypothetical protein [Gordonia]|nr:hypothetical protein [Gordonia sp. SMJS1]WGJ88123.1 hypothetical protein QAD21_23885 [Gordonia sp. SMJS1]
MPLNSTHRSSVGGVVNGICCGVDGVAVSGSDPHPVSNPASA